MSSALNVQDERKRLKTTKQSIHQNATTEPMNSLKETANQLRNVILEEFDNLPEALEYIAKLQRKIHKLKEKLKRFRRKNTEVVREDASIQTDHPIPLSIVDEVREAAEIATHNSGFVYEDKSGLYYDTNTGYYYNPEYRLYYDAKTGTYLQYKSELRSYLYYSHVVLPQHQSQPQKRRQLKMKKTSQRVSKTIRNSSRKNSSSLSGRSTEEEAEDGECTNSDYSNEEIISDMPAYKQQQWPPCMRIIVDQSTNTKIRVGSLHIVTCQGGTLGREGGTHAVHLPDINISKVHLKFEFDEKEGVFQVLDLGSRNGTLLNGERMSPAMQESDWMPCTHGSRIQLGGVSLICHIHSGSETCAQCEPGLLLSSRHSEDIGTEVPPCNLQELHKRELKQLRKKFGINPYVEAPIKLAAGYADRAEKRRKTVGSQNPHEKTETASVDEAIATKNKGFKMLQRMGWKQGESLGKDNTGITEPVPLLSNPGTTGLGGTSVNVIIETDSSAKKTIWKKTKDRLQSLPTATNPLFDNDDSD